MLEVVRGVEERGAESGIDCKGERNGRKGTAFVVGLILWFVSAAAAQALDLTVVAGTSTGEVSMAVGDSLWVGARGLAPGAAADFRLRDANGNVVFVERARADDKGQVGAALLWYHTGIVGCGPSSQGPISVPRFSTYEQAEASLIGQRWSVVMTDANGTPIAAPRMIRMIRTETLQVFLSDSRGCPLHEYEPGKSVFLGIRGPVLPAWARVYVVAERPEWQTVIPFDDERFGVGSDGTLHALTGTTLSLFEISDGSLPAGFYGVVVRVDPGGGIPSADPNRQTDDFLITSGFTGTLRGAAEEGLIIRDWGAN